uniref:Uncharacterized protein n=1 Tax=Rhizophora mucronata TaxID=61149 RepID=A0A2P2PG44_RHIMU
MIYQFVGVNGNLFSYV